MNLENQGVICFSEQFPKEKLQGIVICGLPRSGTTGLANCFLSAGFNLGNDLSSVLEDQDFRRAVSPYNSNLMTRYVQSREPCDGDLPWVAKFPDAYKELSKISRLSNIAVIIITRDPTAIAIRNNISVFQEISFLIDKALSEYSSLTNILFGLKDKSRVVLMTYEKLLSSPERTLSTIFDWLSLTSAGSQDLVSAAVSGICLDPVDYLNESNLIPLYAIDCFNSNKVCGWCFLKAAPSRTVELVLEFKNREISRASCDLFRPDLVNINKKGKCAFNFVFDFSGSDNEFTENSRIRIQHTNHYLVPRS